MFLSLIRAIRIAQSPDYPIISASSQRLVLLISRFVTARNPMIMLTLLLVSMVMTGMELLGMFGFPSVSLRITTCGRMGVCIG
jgi:hypothetical protein